MSLAGRKTRPLVFGVAGVGGYAGVVCEQLLAGAQRSEPSVVLAAACEPNPVNHGPTIARLRASGVRVYASVDDMLGDDHIEAVWLPLPIALHRPFTERALAAGKAVLCEKPAAGSVDDVDAMIAARDRYGLPVAVGFQDVYDPQVLDAKREILDGTLGRVESATVHVCWPRDGSYYRRSNWAGRLRQGGAWVLDSPANNAMAHFLNLALFLLGHDEPSSATPVNVEAELYRVNPIENYDTCSLRLTLDGGVRVLVLMTHASTQQVEPTIVIKGDRGELRFDDMKSIELRGVRHAREADNYTRLHAHMQDAFAGLVRTGAGGGGGGGGGRTWGPSTQAIATLEVARAHTVAVNGASEASDVRTVPDRFVPETPSREGHTLRSIPGIETVLAQCAADGQMLHESGLVPWSTPAGMKDLHDYRHFAGPKPAAAPPRDVQG
jgi:predicted dehydrogenase